MPILLSTAEMNDLAQKLARMRFNRAKGYARGLDKHSRLELFRTVVDPDTLVTRFALPTKGLRITLIERKEVRGVPSKLGYTRMRFRFVEARVEALPDYAYHENIGNPGIQIQDR